VATDWVPAVTAGIGAAAAIGGQAVSARFQGRNQERAEERQRRERAVAVLADVRLWLTDAQQALLGEEEVVPDVGMVGWREKLDKLEARSRPIRQALVTMGIGHPSERIRELSQRLDDALAVIVGRISEITFSLNPENVGVSPAALAVLAHLSLDQPLQTANELIEAIGKT
jgi:hypothetical protein